MCENFPSEKDLYSGKSGSKKTQSYIHKYYPNFEQFILNNYNFASSWIEKLYCYFRNIENQPTCHKCGKPVKFHGFTFGYSNFCSNRCSMKSTSTLNKYKSTCIKNMGLKTLFNQKK